MGCRILEGTADGTGHGAVFYDSTTGVAFGPMMADGEQAEAFCQWIPGDPRNYSQQELMAKYSEFTRLYVCECGEIRKDTCDWCEDFAEEWPLGADGKHHFAARPLDECPQKPHAKCNHADPDLCCGGGYDTELKRSVGCSCTSCHEQVTECEKDPAPENGKRFECRRCRSKRERDARLAARRAEAK